MSDDVNDFLLSGGVPWASFETIGASVEGTITATSTRQSRDFLTGEDKTWSNGDPMMEVVITLQTEQRDASIEDDDGARQLVVNKTAMKQAIAAALRSTKSRLEVGGTLKVTYVSDAKPKQRGLNGAKQFEAQYTAPVPMNEQEVAAALGGEPVGAEVGKPKFDW